MACRMPPITATASPKGPDGVDTPDGISVPEWWCCKSLEQASVNQVSTVGLDLAKPIFQLHGADRAGAVVFRKKLRRGQLLAFLATLPPCTVAMEACGSAHYWGRKIAKLGHTVKLIAPAYVKPFVKRQKNDMADAEALLARPPSARPCGLLPSRARTSRPTPSPHAGPAGSPAHANHQ